MFTENFKVFKMWKGGNYVRSNNGYQKVNIKLIYIKRQIHSPETNNFEQFCILSYAVQIYHERYFLIPSSKVNYLFIHHPDL